MKIELEVTVVQANGSSNSPQSIVGDFRSFNELPDAEIWMNNELKPRLISEGAAAPGDKVMAKIVSCPEFPASTNAYLLLGLEMADIARLDLGAPASLLRNDPAALRVMKDELDAASESARRTIDDCLRAYHGLVE